MLTHFIYEKEIENFNAKDFLDKANTFYENKWVRSLTIGDQENPIRSSDSAFLQDEPGLDKQIFDIFAEHILEYRKLFPEVYIEKDEGYTLLRYSEGGYYGKHTDDFSKMHRIVSGLIYLNDDYEGGELYFNELDVKIKPKAGSIVLFPSNFVYAHECLKITKGTKYAVVTWFV